MFLPPVANLPEPRIRLRDGSLAETSQICDELLLVFGPQVVEAVVTEDRREGQNQLANGRSWLNV